MNGQRAFAGSDTVAGRLRAAVAGIGTQAEAARVAGISERQLRRYLAGSAPPVEVIERIANKAGLDPMWVRVGSNAAPHWVTADDPELGESLERAGEALEKASRARSGAERAKCLFSYLRFAMEPQLKRLYAQSGIELTEAEAHAITERTFDSLGEGEPDSPVFEPSHWPAATELVVQSHRQALGLINRAT